MERIKKGRGIWPRPKVDRFRNLAGRLLHSAVNLPRRLHHEVASANGILGCRYAGLHRVNKLLVPDKFAVHHGAGPGKDAHAVAQPLDQPFNVHNVFFKGREHGRQELGILRRSG